MKIYGLNSVTVSPNGEVYGWTTYTYQPKRQSDPKFIFLHRLYTNPLQVQIKRSYFELDPKFDLKKHDNSCPYVFFTSTDNLVEFLREGYIASAKRLIKTADKIYPRRS